MTHRASTLRFLVRPGQEQLRLDQFLPAVCGLSRRAARRLIADGAVWRNGGALRVQSKSLDPGDVIDVLDPSLELEEPPWRPEPIHFAFDDRWMAVVEKPAGILTQPSEASPGRESALDERVLLFLAHREGRRPFLRTVHRLDRQTSGLVVFARNRQALPLLDRLWRSGQVQRFYVALVTGCPNAPQVIDRPIARDREHTWRFKVDPKGKPARTEIRVLHRWDDRTAVLCRLDTGRTHQVRVHLAHLGHPVVGDRLYGGRETPDRSVALHAWALVMPHPKSGDTLRLTAAIPSSIRTLTDDVEFPQPWSLP